MFAYKLVHMLAGLVDRIQNNVILSTSEKIRIHLPRGGPDLSGLASPLRWKNQSFIGKNPFSPREVMIPRRR